MRQIKAEINRSFTDFLFEIRCLSNDVLDQIAKFLSDCSWLNVPKEGWKCLLEEFQESDEIFQDWVFEAFLYEVEECAEINLDRHVLTIDFSRHCISSVGVQVVKLLLYFLNSCKSCCPIFREGTGDDRKTEEFYQVIVLTFLFLG